MGSEAPPKLAIYKLPISAGIKSGDNYDELGMMMGISTPPHHSASIPFRWEEQPGKPRPCKTLSLPSEFRGLELPPRLLNVSKFTKTPSPTTVLEGPYVGRSIFRSLRVLKNREASADGGESSPERGLLGSLVLAKRNKDKGSFVFSSSRKRSMLGLTKARSNFWATIYGAVKQAITSPWRRKRN